MQITFRPTPVLSALALAVMAACGGGGDANPTDPGPDLTAAVASRGVEVAATPSGSTVVVRARATLAGGVGATMVVRADGQALGSQSVGHVDGFQDYRFTSPTVLGAGARVDVVFVNDGVTVVNGVRTEDRNLIVESISVDGGAPLLPTDPGVLLDRGDGPAAFDGVDTLPGQSGLWWNGALRFVKSTLPTPAASVRIRARATLAGGVAPQMKVMIDGVVADPPSVDVGNVGVAQDYVFTASRAFPASRIDAASRIDVVYTNDGATFVNGHMTEDRNLVVESLTVGDGPAISASSPGVALDRGAGLAAFDGIDTLPGQAYLAWNGALRFSLAELALAGRQPVASGLQSLSAEDKLRAARLGYLATQVIHVARTRRPGAFDLMDLDGSSPWLAPQPAAVCRLGGSYTSTLNGAPLPPGSTVTAEGALATLYAGPCSTRQSGSGFQQDPAFQMGAVEGSVTSNFRKSTSSVTEFGITTTTLRSTEGLHFSALRRTETQGTGVYAPGLGLQDISLQGSAAFGSTGQFSPSVHKYDAAISFSMAGLNLTDRASGATAQLDGTVAAYETGNRSLGLIDFRVLPLNLSFTTGGRRFSVQGVSYMSYFGAEQHSDDYTISLDGRKVGRVFGVFTLPRMVEIDGRLTPL